MGAAEDQHIYPVLLHLLQICLGSQPCHLVVCPAFFCKGYKQRAWLCEYSNRLVNGFYGIKICPALYSTFSAYYAYLFGLGYLNRPSSARSDSPLPQQVLPSSHLRCFSIQYTIGLCNIGRRNPRVTGRVRAKKRGGEMA